MKHLSKDAIFFQRIFNSMPAVEVLPEEALLGDLCKTKNGTNWVWQNGWIRLDDAMKLVYKV